MNTFITFLLFASSFAFTPHADESLIGAWGQQDKGTIQSRIYVNGFFSVSTYSLEGKQFAGTFGGKYKVTGGNITEMIEFDTRNPERVGTTQESNMTVSKGNLTLTSQPGITFKRLDHGGPGKLSGAWLITGRVRDNELKRSTPGARRTMKILSGTRFQWIAYNVDTKEFFGTGGGNYTTLDGKYTENIEFFSRDSTRVGMSLSFEYSLEEGDWHHKGLSSKGEPIHELWTLREKIGL